MSGLGGQIFNAGVILLVVLALANVVLIVLGIRRFRVVDKAMCGHCGHTLHSLDSGRCGECGSVLVRAGVQAGQVRPGLPTWIIVVLILFVSGVFILCARGIVEGVVEEIVPSSVTVYRNEIHKDVDGSLFPTDEKEGGRFFLRIGFFEEKIGYEGEHVGYYDWEYSPRELQIMTMTEASSLKANPGPSSLGPPLRLEQPVQESGVRDWLLLAGAKEDGEDGAVRFEALLQEITEEAENFRTKGSEFKLSSTVVNSYGNQVGNARRKAWVALVIEAGVFVFYGIVIALLMAWVKIRKRRLGTLGT